LGKGIGQQFGQASLGTELIYSFIIIAISLIIYFGTRELYSLTKHKGIKYFRLSFLFFAIAYFFRSFIKSMVVFFEIPRTLYSSFGVLGPLSLFLFMYASSMVIFYLLFSVAWKKTKTNKIFLFHILAIIIAIITLLIQNSLYILIIHFILFLFVTGVIYLSYKQAKKKNKKSHLHGIYILLFIFWIFNILDLLVPNVLVGFQLLIYLISISIFLAILYKVLKKIGP